MELGSWERDCGKVLGAEVDQMRRGWRRKGLGLGGETVKWY